MFTSTTALLHVTVWFVLILKLLFMELYDHVGLWKHSEFWSLSVSHVMYLFFHLYACWSRQLFSSQGMSLHVCSTWSGLLFFVCNKLQWNVIGIERFSFRCRKVLRYVCGPVMSSVTVTCVWLLSVKVLQYQCIVVELSILCLALNRR